MSTTITLSRTLLATTFLAAFASIGLSANAQTAPAPVVSGTQAVMGTAAQGLEAAATTLRERRWADAIALYKPLVNTSDNVVRAQARYGLALAFSQLGDEAEAYKILEGTLRDDSALGRAVGDLRGRLALQLAERFLAEKGHATQNPWLGLYERQIDQPDRDRYERLKAANDVYRGNTTSMVLRVGVLLPMDGQLGDVGTSILHGLHLGLREFDGRRGTKIALLVVNSGGDSKAHDVAAQLLQQQVDIVVGPLLAPVVAETAALLRPHGIPILAFSNDKSVMGNGVHALSYLPSAQARLAARAAVRRGARNLAVLAPSTDYGTESLEAFADEAKREGATLTGTAYFDPKATDIGASIRQLTGANATSSTLPFNGLFVPAPAARMPLIRAQLSYYSVTPANTLLLGSGLWQNNDLLRNTSGMRGALFAAPPKVTTFEQTYKATFGEDANPLAITGYDTLRILADIAGEKQRTGKSLATLLTRPEGFYGSGGYFRFRADGLTERGLDVVNINNQFEVQKPALNLPPLELPANLQPEGLPRNWRW